MLTRLKVSGFKNLVNVDVRFGPFTCIAGTNGVGKSNLFDAITFLSALADRPLMEAAQSIRDESGKTTDVQTLFGHAGDRFVHEMSFEAEMIVPRRGVDDLGQAAQASITFLAYKLVLVYRQEAQSSSRGSLELRTEELKPIKLGDANKHILFENSPKWRKQAISGRRSVPFISTGEDGRIRLHQDTTAGRPVERPASTLTRTVVSATNAAESPTALLARREMQSWRLLQLEPSALRKPDDFSASPQIRSDGSHLAATLNHLPKAIAFHDDLPISQAESLVLGRIANRLSELIEDVRSIAIDRDERRELLTVQVTSRDGTTHSARALSDGTLRFLALAVLEMDPDAQGVICLEEPENGIHPARVAAMLQLLQDIALDPEEPIGTDNPLRQVIINTHSPVVVKLVPDQSLLLAENREVVIEGQRLNSLEFSHLDGTWRAKPTDDVGLRLISKGKLLAYLDPSIPSDDFDADRVESENGNGHLKRRATMRRVIDRSEIQQLFSFAKPKT